VTTALALLPAAGLPAAAWAAHARMLYRRLHLARRDPLTGLWTRAAWTRRAERMIHRAPCVAILCDLDRFKPVNDRYGHDAGDAVLVAVAERLAAWVGRHGTVARLGGDEFAAVITAEHAARLGELHRSLTAPITVGEQALQVGASVGTAYTAGLTLSQAIKAADEDMFAKKLRGRRGRALVARVGELVGIGGGR
jgi:diguanylate cyclase (GGDEF)-like protein